jgi:hypothetical protein
MDYSRSSNEDLFYQDWLDDQLEKTMKELMSRRLEDIPRLTGDKAIIDLWKGYK